jgi:hypothetical protein
LLARNVLCDGNSGKVQQHFVLYRRHPLPTEFCGEPPGMVNRQNYGQMALAALYFSHFFRKSWRNIDPKLILSAAYSSGSGWETNVNYRLRRANVSLPDASKGQQGC